MIYLIHFERPLHHARHYLGYCADETLQVRLIRHRASRGARLLAVLRTLNINWEVVRVFEGDRRFERTLKNRRNTPRLCPVCTVRPVTPRRLKTESMPRTRAPGDFAAPAGPTVSPAPLLNKATLPRPPRRG